MITLEIPVRTVSITNLREHWAARHRRSRFQREAVRIVWVQVVKEKRIPLPCVVVLTRIAPGILDSDNLPSSCKSIRDEIASLIGVDDGDPCIAWHYQQERSDPGLYAVRVEIIPVESNPRPWATPLDARLCRGHQPTTPGMHA